MTDTPTPAEVARALRDMGERLTKIETSRIPFTPDEVEQLKRAADIIDVLNTLGRVGRILFWIAGGIVLAISQGEKISQFIGWGKP